MQTFDLFHVNGRPFLTALKLLVAKHNSYAHSMINETENIYAHDAPTTQIEFKNFNIGSANNITIRCNWKVLRNIFLVYS